MAYNSRLGVQVVKGATDLPAGVGQNNLYTIAGGAVWVTALIGRVSTLFGAGPANASLRHNVGAVNTAICAATAAGNTALNTRLWVTGIAANSLQFLAPAAANVSYMGLCGAIVTQVTTGLVMLDGTIQLDISAAMGGGATSWVLYYIPLEVGATVVAA